MGSREVSLEECVPVVDVSEILVNSSSGADISSASAKKVVKEVRNACVNWGFFYLVGHGVDPLLMEELRNVAKDFFHMPLEYKKKVQRLPNNYRGYTDYELTKQRKDWKEAFDFGSEATKIVTISGGIDLDAGKNQWPEGMHHFKDVLTKYFSTLHTLSSILMDLIFMSLEVNPALMRHHFSEGKDTSFCRLNYYPPCPDASSALGVGPHSDAGVLTVLLQDDRVASLQVEKDGRFHTVRPIPGSFVINIGDMMQIWSNGLYKAPVHRVLANSIKERFSVPFFFNPAYKSNVEPLESCISNERPLRYRPVNWGMYRQGRILGDYADYGEEIQISQFEIN